MKIRRQRRRERPEGCTTTTINRTRSKVWSRESDRKERNYILKKGKLERILTNVNESTKKELKVERNGESNKAA